MGIKKVTKPAADTITEGTFVDTIIGVALAPVKAFSVSDVYINEQDAGVQALSHLAIGFGLGEALGHRRAAKGSKSFVPIFRG